MSRGQLVSLAGEQRLSTMYLMEYLMQRDPYEFLMRVAWHLVDSAVWDGVPLEAYATVIYLATEIRMEQDCMEVANA